MRSDKIIASSHNLQNEIRTCTFRNTGSDITSNSICTVYNAGCLAAIESKDCVQVKKCLKKGGA